MPRQSFQAAMTLPAVCVADADAEPVERDLLDKHAPPRANLSRLGALQPTALLPSREGARRRRVGSVLALRRIESLEVRAANEQERGGDSAHYYYVDLYYRGEQSRIPVHGAFAPKASMVRKAPEPSATVALSYEAFLQLSHRAYELTRLAHTTASCAFCRPVIFFNTTSALRPRWNSHWFKSDRQVGEMLSRYLQEMVTRTAAAPASHLDLCHGHKRVARLLQRLLTPPEDHERASI